MLDAELRDHLFDFEGVEQGLPLLPLAARRALDVAGFRLSLEGWQSLHLDDRKQLILEGGRETVDPNSVERVVRRALQPATRIRKVPDPDPLQPPEQLVGAVASRRPLAAAEWSKLRSLDRYALVHVLRRAVAHDDPQRLDQALASILPSWSAPPPRSSLPAANQGFESRSSSLPPAFEVTVPALSTELLAQSPEASGGVVDRERVSTRSGPAPHDLSSHVTASGEATMVDVGDKAKTDRRATASGTVRMRKETAQRLARNEGPKGEVLGAARIAGMMAAKRTPELIPLCHQVALTKVEVHVDVETLTGIVTVMCIVEARDRTGVEMEALTAVSVSCLTIYDMLKGIDPDMVIGDIKLLQKAGGRGGAYERKE